MSFVDHESSFQVDFPRDIVFARASAALKANKMFKIREINPVMHTIILSAGMSLFSWGENISINIKERSANATEIIILSTPVTGAMFGGAFDMGKNRKNIEDVIKCISAALLNITQNSTKSSTAPTEPPTQTSPPVVTDPLSFLFVCPFCNANLDCPVELENTICKCPQCNQEICPTRNCDTM